MHDRVPPVIPKTPAPGPTGGPRVLGGHRERVHGPSLGLGPVRVLRQHCPPRAGWRGQRQEGTCPACRPGHKHRQGHWQGPPALQDSWADLRETQCRPGLASVSFSPAIPGWGRPAPSRGPPRGGLVPCREWCLPRTVSQAAGGQRLSHERPPLTGQTLSPNPPPVASRVLFPLCLSILICKVGMILCMGAVVTRTQGANIC